MYIWICVYVYIYIYVYTYIFFLTTNFSGELVNYMERNKAVLRKLKKGFVRRKKVEESRFFNRTYQVDPSRIYKGFNEFARNQGTDRPVYKSMEDVDKEH